MTAQRKLEAYLDAFRRRLRKLIVVRGIAALALVALFLTLGAVYLGIRQAFAWELIISARILLVIILGLVATGLLINPLRALRRSHGVEDIERRAPGFDGRVETYQGLTDAEQTSPFLGLLAEDTLRVARGLPITLRVPKWEISVPAALAVVAMVLLVGLAAFGPGNWKYGVRHLWVGWALSDTLPPQRIAVTPGDKVVRRGGDLTISAVAEGFDPVAAEVFALFDGGDAWENTFMQRLDDERFEFVFFAVRQPLHYYVVAAGVRSAEYTVDVVDLPLVRNIKLTYHYPSWTQLEQRVEDPGSDIRAIEGTDVRLNITTDQSLGEAELVVNGQALTMQINGNVSSGTLQVSEDGEYFVSTFFDGDSVRLTEDYFITLIPDNKPVVKLIKPARDWRASNIEEVTVRVEATDDFGLNSLKLHYSVNGGELQELLFDAEGSYTLAEEILYLEDIAKFAPPESIVKLGTGFPFSGPTIDWLQGNAADESVQSFEVAREDSGEVRLQAGDLISYYVEAKDQDQSVRTDLFFVEVQPFNRSYSQSTQGGGSGGGGGQRQDEISQRQKEILVATWNLIRERTEGSTFLDEQQLQDNAAMLAGLQRTLAEQAQTLASRTRARQLTRVDDQIQAFVENLERAAEAMMPAVDRLADLELEEAVPSEQAALQHLLRAEAVFTDIQVAFNQEGGGRGFAGRDLSELFELEMDLEKNQYETEAPVSLDSGDQQPEIDEAIAKLQELARRQENLARQANNRQSLSEEERWEQDMLRRETEELKRQLEQLQRQLEQVAAGQPSDQSGGQQQSDQQDTSQSQLTAGVIRQLENALEAMNRATDENSADADPQQAQRSIERARRQLNRALEQMTGERQAAVAAAFSDLANRSQDLYEKQRQIAAELQQIMRDVLEAQKQADVAQSNPSRDESYELARRKLAMQQRLEELEQDIQSVAHRFRSETPGASTDLTKTLTELQQSQTIAILRDAAEKISRGAAAQVAATHEPITTSALRELQSGTQEALMLAIREAVEGSEPEFNPNAVLLQELQALRQDLAELMRGNTPRQSEQRGTQQGAQRGGGQRTSGDYSGPYRGIEDWGTPLQGFQRDPQSDVELQNRLRDAGRELINLATRLTVDGLGQEELEAVQLLANALRGGLRGNPELVEQEFQSMLNLFEQLELQLRAQTAGQSVGSGVRTEAPAEVARGYKEVVAEYFRRLSRAEFE